MTNKAIKKTKLLNEAFDTFDQVSKKVEGLINCSVKDFVILNSNFKKYHNNLKTVSDSTSGFLDLILDINKFNSQSFINKSNYEIEPIKRNLKDQLGKFRITQKNTNYTLLIINNLKQDLSTIKLLFTNLKFDPLVTTDYKHINKFISNTGDCLETYEKKLKEFSNSLEPAIKHIEDNFQPGIEVFQERYDKVFSSINYIFSLNTDANANKEVLNELGIKKANSTSEIITNLQFQDILRQKIEHVQTAHDQIVQNLSKTSENDNNFEPEELLQIRDISTLQSAQLIHANQEYQNAVETIVHKFNELNYIFQNYLSVWNQFCKTESIKLQAINTKLTEDFSVLSTQTLSLKYISENYNKLLLQVSGILDELNITGKLQSPLCRDLILFKETFKSIFESQHIHKEYRPLLQINNEIEKIETGFKKLDISINELLKDIEKHKKLLDPEIHKQIDKFNNYTKELKDFFEADIYDKLNALSTKMHVEPTENFNVDQVAYYKTFEKEVQEIINMLDNLLVGIDVSKKEISKDRLEHLRNMYTMDSERKVHEIITGDTTKTSDNEKQDDNDEVEFF